MLTSTTFLEKEVLAGVLGVWGCISLFVDSLELRLLYCHCFRICHQEGFISSWSIIQCVKT